MDSIDAMTSERSYSRRKTLDEAMDEMVAFAHAHDMQVHGHVLLWHISQPAWWTELPATREGLMDALSQHIHTVAGHFHGKTGFAEALRDGFLQRLVVFDEQQFHFRPHSNVHRTMVLQRTAVECLRLAGLPCPPLQQRGSSAEPTAGKPAR